MTTHSEMTQTARSFASAVRAYHKPTIWNSIRRYLLTRKAGAVGPGLTVDGNVRFLRHPGNISLGSNIILKEGVRLCPARSDASIEIGDWTTIGYHTFVFASYRITIGANCLIAPFCYLVDANHGIKKGSLIRAQEMTASPIILGDDVWIGANVTVLAGVTIGSGAVVGAGSVVTTDVEAESIVAGSPARLCGYRKS